MNKRICRFSEGMIMLPEGYCERTLNTLADVRSKQPPVTISRDSLGNHNSVEEYIGSQLSILQKQVKEWKQDAFEEAILGEHLATGIMITYNFMRPDNVCMFQKQAIFTLDMENLLIFSLSRIGAITEEDRQRFNDILNSFRFHA